MQMRCFGARCSKKTGCGKLLHISAIAFRGEQHGGRGDISAHRGTWTSPFLMNFTCKNYQNSYQSWPCALRNYFNTCWFTFKNNLVWHSWEKLGQKFGKKWTCAFCQASHVNHVRFANKPCMWSALWGQIKTFDSVKTAAHYLKHNSQCWTLHHSIMGSLKYSISTTETFTSKLIKSVSRFGSGRSSVEPS